MKRNLHNYEPSAHFRFLTAKISLPGLLPIHKNVSMIILSENDFKSLRSNFMSNSVHGLEFGTSEFYIAHYGKINNGLDNLGPAVQSIVSLTNSLRGQLVKCFFG